MNEQRCTWLVRGRAVAYDPSLRPDADYLPCESCGRWSDRLERHHRQFRSRGGVWVPSNVVLICRDCHEDATDEAPWVQGSGLNVHSFEEPTEVPVRLWYADGWALLDDDGNWWGVDKA